MKIHKYDPNANFFISIILWLLDAHTYNSSSETTYPHCVRMYNIYRSEHLGTGILTLQLKKNEKKSEKWVGGGHPHANLTVLRVIYIQVFVKFRKRKFTTLMEFSTFFCYFQSEGDS